MKTLFSTLIAFGLTLSFTIAQTNPSITIYFERNSAELSEEALSELSDFVEAFGLRPLANIRISGHTDADGSEAYNRTLSLERTSSVKDYIQQNQRLPDAVILNGFGESAPIADNASAKGQGLNRRVEVVVELSKAGYSDSWKRFEPKSQIFERDASAAFELKGTGGTIIKFPAEAFVDGYGNSVDGMVEIALTEYINPSDFLFGGLHTQSDERLLETGGTVFIEAKNNAGRLKLKDDKTIELGFATRVEGDNMQTFYGEVSENGLNWRAAAQASNSAVAFNSFRYLSEHVEGNIVTAEMIDVNGVKSLKTYTLDGRVPTDSIQIEQYKKQGEITSLMLKSSKLGWINCDRFYNGEANSSLLVNLDTSFHANVFLVFEDINSIMSSNVWSQELDYGFRGIPTGKKAKLVAFSCVNEQTYFTTISLTTMPDQQLTMALNPISEADLKRELKRLN